MIIYWWNWWYFGRRPLSKSNSLSRTRQKIPKIYLWPAITGLNIDLGLPKFAPNHDYLLVETNRLILLRNATTLSFETPGGGRIDPPPARLCRYGKCHAKARVKSVTSDSIGIENQERRHCACDELPNRQICSLTSLAQAVAWGV